MRVRSDDGGIESETDEEQTMKIYIVDVRKYTLIKRKNDR